MLSAKEIVRCPICSPEDWKDGHVAAEVVLSGWSKKWVVSVYHSLTGKIHKLTSTGLRDKEAAMQYVKELKSVYKQMDS